MMNIIIETKYLAQRYPQSFLCSFYFYFSSGITTVHHIRNAFTLHSVTYPQFQTPCSQQHTELTVIFFPF